MAASQPLWQRVNVCVNVVSQNKARQGDFTEKPLRSLSTIKGKFIKITDWSLEVNVCCNSTLVFLCLCLVTASNLDLSAPEATDFHDYKAREREREVWMACFDPPTNPMLPVPLCESALRVEGVSSVTNWVKQNPGSRTVACDLW